MLNDKMQEALNSQLNAELFSSYLYLAMSAYLKTAGFDGFSHWMRVQAQEEMVHGAMFYDYILSRDGKVALAQIEKPDAVWGSPLEAAEATLAHERKVTGLINTLMELAHAEKDYAAVQFLQWFVAEQVEEEASAEDLVRKLKLAGSDGSALLMIDGELSQRPALYQVPPAK